MTSSSNKRTVGLLLAVTAAAALATVSATAAPNLGLKDEMKRMQALVVNGDAKGLGPLFASAKARSKPEFSNWSAIADKGKAAADKGDLDGAKATCKECHDAYRNEYMTKYGSKAP